MSTIDQDQEAGGQGRGIGEGEWLCFFGVAVTKNTE